ncbi:S-adenosyl-L-methionine-dependent methyltransferase [Hypoxylon crocopeplum]|nr:S-adenosyl-L-methionine-dependent methyltransferase [Hypoxylon crocopeplum]
MDMDHNTLCNWQRLPGSGDLAPRTSQTPDLVYDQPLLEQPASYLDRIFPSIEDDAVNLIRIDSSSIQESEDEAEIPVTTAQCLLVRDGTTSDASGSEWEGPPLDDQEVAPDIRTTDTTIKRPIFVELPRSTLTQPRSLFDGFVPPAPEVRELDALTTLLEAARPQQSPEDDFYEFDLHEFSIYMVSDIYPYELRPLQHLACRQAADRFYFDGMISYDDKRFYLKGIPFQQLPIGNYGSEEHTVGDQIWIRSTLNERNDSEIYYKLISPAPEYARFFEPFLWIADLAKHVLDYCDHLKEKGRRAVLHDFRSQFSIWLVQKHSMSPVFERWHSANRNTDFRGAIHANIEFIWREAYGLDPQITSWHSIWREIKTLDQYNPNLGFDPDSSEDDVITRPRERKSQKRIQVSPTIVTPYVYNLFSHMVFGKILREERPSVIVEKKRSVFIEDSRPIEQSIPPTVKRDDRDRGIFIDSIQVGDVISTKPDDDETDTQWKKRKSEHHEDEHLWFGVVQMTYRLPRGKRSFDVIWMYQPIDTPCGVMKYPWRNELFLSNNCTCHHETAKVKDDEILSTHSVEWFGNPSTSAEFFVRQTYLSDDCRWTTLKKEHLTCAEERFREDHPYKVGDAVLAETNRMALRLEPFIVEEFFEESNKQYVRLRRLLRRKVVDKGAPNSPPNELVYTDQLVEFSSSRIFRHCLLRAFQAEEKIPTPYDCKGTGDVFFMTHREVETIEGGNTCVPLDISLLHQLRQGFNPSSHHPEKLQGLDLFCGGGNFGRGLEDGGAIEMRWANDIWTEAIHTYMANTKPGTCTPFLGSVDDLLRRALYGNGSKIPRPGDVHFISAGSPCPGFSSLTADKTTDNQRKNQSLVASFASYVDLYRPYYGLLENVPTMVNSKNFREACVFSQLVCALVGLNYQVQVMFLDAWSFGAPQLRSRVFLCFSAPGLRMPKAPAPSHSHPPGTRLTKLGEMSCGRPFDGRKLVPTPFKYVSIREATDDLPNIQDSKVDFCVGFPHHRLSIGFTPTVRKQLFQIPTQPWEMNFSKAWHGRPGMPPVMSKSDRGLFPDRIERTKTISRGWGRVHPNRLLNCISTRCMPSDARTGTMNHWFQHRPLSLMEARRAQGFHDHEVLVGSIANQWRIIGNSVARQVSIALGLAIREAWFGTLLDEPHLPQAGLTRIADKPTSEIDDVLFLNCVTTAEATAKGIEVEVDTSLTIRGDSSSSDTISEDIFLLPTHLQKPLSLTPPTSESIEMSDCENSRKRSTTLHVEILAKRFRLGSEWERPQQAASLSLDRT